MSKKSPKKSTHRWLVAASSLAVAFAGVAQAQAQESAPAEIVVTATKKANGETVQQVPLAMSALGPAQLEGRVVNNLKDLSYAIPNVQLDTIGTNIGTVNYSIRGLGTNASVPTTEPYVGIFVDGVYIGIPTGLGNATFDLEGVEVLRGPQGVLFGRNVVGGAVLMRTTKPMNDLTANFRVGLESGLKTITTATVSGPIIKDLLAVKLAAYYSNDDGWWRNDFNGRSFGTNREYAIRPAIALRPGPHEFILRLEKGGQKGDGIPTQNPVLNGFYDSFHFSNDFSAYFSTQWQQAIFESNIAVGFGDGRITNVAGYRELKTFQGIDADGLPSDLFTSEFRARQHQFSNELRYAGTFGLADVTAGLFYLEQYVTQFQRRRLFVTTRQHSGGRQWQTALGAFASIDWHLTDSLTLNTGLRYSWEKKRAEVNPLAAVATSPCSYDNAICSSYLFHDKNTWDGFSPKIGLQWQPNNDVNIYGSFAKGLRSGGYNISANPIPSELNPGGTLKPVGPLEQETVTSFEVGGKYKFAPSSYINIAAFRTKLSDVQRQITVQTQLTGILTFLANVGDLRIQGIEIEGQVRLFDQLTINGQVGYLDGNYTKVDFDLNGDRTINALDKSLKTPRLAPWTAGVGFTFTQDLANAGRIELRGDYSYRDRQFHSDNNAPPTYYRAVNLVNGSIAYVLPGDQLRFSIYGKNLGNKITYSTLVPLGSTFGGAGSALNNLNRGRVIGGEMSYRY